MARSAMLPSPLIRPAKESLGKMRTVVLATQKGGSGKSTLAIGLALALVFRIVLLCLLVWLIGLTQPLLTVISLWRRSPWAT